METFSALLAICAGNSPVPVNSPHKGQWGGALMVSLICVWISGWVNNPEAGDLKCYHAHYDIIVMINSASLVRSLTHWGRAMHICVSKLTIIASDNDLFPGRRQSIIWTNDGILLIGPLGTNFSEIWSKIHPFSFCKMHLKTSSAKWRTFCLGLNVLKSWQMDMV